MAIAYARVLVQQDAPFVVIGRGKSSAQAFQGETGIVVQTGGLRDWLKRCDKLPHTAIVAVGPGQLAQVTRALLDAGTKRILIEKPGALTLAELGELVIERKRTKADIYVAYNRRYYASTLKAQEIIERDGGVKSFCFEFTEWSHRLEKSGKPANELAQWFFLNSSHVVDLAFHLGGRPVSFKGWANGGVSWHPSASVFCGAGVTCKNALFSYHANWEAPGRWGVEIMTRQHRLVLRPMEHLSVQKLGSLEFTEVSLDDELDRRFKPGVFREVEEFLEDVHNCKAPTLDEHHELWRNVLAPIATPTRRRHADAA